MKIKINDSLLNTLSVMLSAIPKDKLYWEDMGSCSDKWKALTIRSKILAQIEESNKDFAIETGKLANEHQGLQKKTQELLAEITALATDEDTEEQKKEQKKEEMQINKELGEKISKATEKAGFKLYPFLPPNAQQPINLLDYKDEKDVKIVGLELDDKYKQGEFIAEQMQQNMFDMVIADKYLSELSEIFIT